MNMRVPLGYMRAQQLQFMPDRVRVVRRTISPDGFGGNTKTSTTVYDNQMCRVSPPDLGRFAYRPQEVIVSEKEGTIVPYLVTFPMDVTIEYGDLIISNGNTLEVVKIISGGGYKTATRVACKEYR